MTRLQRALSRDTNIKLGSLVALLKRRTQSKGEMLEHLLGTHFPNSVVTEEMAACAAAHCAKWCDWQVATEVVTYGRVEQAMNSFAGCKSPGMDGIFPAVLQQWWRIVVPYLVRIFHACLVTGSVPAIWRLVKVVLIPKPSRSSCTGTRDCRPISLISFPLKTMQGWWKGF